MKVLLITRCGCSKLLDVLEEAKQTLYVPLDDERVIGAVDSLPPRIDSRRFERISLVNISRIQRIWVYKEV